MRRFTFRERILPLSKRNSQVQAEVYAFPDDANQADNMNSRTIASTDFCRQENRRLLRRCRPRLEWQERGKHSLDASSGGGC